MYQADALELLRRMQGESVDMVFADPPYFLSNGGITCVGGRMVRVDKGGWDKSQGIIGDHNFNLLWLDQCRRILKPNGTLWVTGTSHNIHSVGYALQVLDYKILNDIAWYKVNPPPEPRLPLLHPCDRDHSLGRQIRQKQAIPSTTP